MEKAEHLYQLRLPLQESYTERLYGLINMLLINKKVSFHLIDKRTKAVESFSKKQSEKKYADPLSEMTDLTGLRIILYYNDHVKDVVRLIEEEFEVDHLNSHSADDINNPNEFGYKSTHLIIKLKKNRSALTEWSHYINYKAEIQIRTVLQHAWASISHALQYKNNQSTYSIAKTTFTSSWFI